MALKNRTSKQWRAACLVGALALISPLAHADDSTDANASSDVQLAEQRAAQAFEAYKNGEYATAVGLYVEAFKAAPSADLLYNIARIYDAKLGDRQLAITFYRKYISDPGAIAERIKRANERLVELREAEIAAGERPAAPARPAPPPRESSSRSSTASQFGLVLGAVGIVGVGLGTGFGLAAMSKSSTAKESCNGNQCTSQKGVDALRDASSSATISTIGFAAGGALLATGAFLFFWGGSKKAEREATSPSVRMGAVATPSHWAVEIGGAW
jgi:tetratricopeptide (TPR) repeat protein